MGLDVEPEHLRIVCAADGVNHAVNSSRGSPHQRRTRCANALSLAEWASDGAYLEGPLCPSTQIDRGLIPIPGTYRPKGHCHFRGRNNSESLTILDELKHSAG